MSKKSFLLSQSHSVHNANFKNWKYNEEEQLNFTENEIGIKVPACTLDTMVTNSKTDNFPGDDDPDPDAEKTF